MDSPVLLFALAIAAIVAVPQCQAGYEIVTSGTNCQRIESKADCEAAANELNLKGWRRWTAEEENVGGSPPSCYTWNGQDLYFNKNGQSQQPCNSDSMICICRKREPGNMVRGLLLSFTWPAKISLFYVVLHQVLPRTSTAWTTAMAVRMHGFAMWIGNPVAITMTIDAMLQ